ncbi:alpha/beta-hydrolase [Patellaria atrata CBS 101060]|uniref:triacylglycerol lipase n=1 Tax=Patellaria atrata CBS 101060 TaxID=1346257 RepID=A0A9P4SJT0_9PEZI|nr:alpha/beta-hydrolase [Patellaria atrata CBS 101060]
MLPIHPRICRSAGRVTATVLLSVALSSYILHPASAIAPLALIPEDFRDIPYLPPGIPLPGSGRDHEKSLQHIFHHGTYKYPHLHRRLDIPRDTPYYIVDDWDTSFSTKELAPPLRVKSHTVSIERLADRSHDYIDGILEFGRMHGRPVSLSASDWTIDKIDGPNVTDKETVVSFARMAANAYIEEHGTGEWEDVGSGFNYTEDFGWSNDGLRGHIFADTTNRTIVIGLKGTSPAVFDGSGTTTNDKLNDNLFFSCCCGQGGQYLWRQVCDCQTSAYTCNSTCLVKALREKNRYYYAAQELYRNVSAYYPDADIWLSGHSLGGAVSSLLGLTYGLPVITFEAVPAAMPASRLGLPTPPGYHIGAHQARYMTGGNHFGHTADPIYMGSCNYASSVCTIGGYAMQSVCHNGASCVYDTVEDLGWRVGAGTHRIWSVIHDVIEKYDDVPKCNVQSNCTDCYLWKYFESNSSETTMTSSSTYSTRTRTATCKTPGWWGCLDESTTTDGSTTESTSTSTSTCKTPGWFGCKDESTTITTSVSSDTAAPAPTITTTSEPTSTGSQSSTSTSCEHPGWFGCKDPTTTPEPTASPTPTSEIPSSTSHSCRSKEWFGLICVDPSPTTAVLPTSTPTEPTCARRSWFGRCKEWEGENYEL